MDRTIRTSKKRVPTGSGVARRAHHSRAVAPNQRLAFGTALDNLDHRRVAVGTPSGHAG
jgi:hypothetical protein